MRNQPHQQPANGARRARRKPARRLPVYAGAGAVVLIAAGSVAATQLGSSPHKHTAGSPAAVAPVTASNEALGPSDDPSLPASASPSPSASVSASPSATSASPAASSPAAAAHAPGPTTPVAQVGPTTQQAAPPPTGFPSASTTGPHGCSSYQSYSGTLDITTAGQTLSCIKLTGTLEINASNVTVTNSILTGTDWWGIRYGNEDASATGFRLLDSRLSTTPGQGPDNGGYDYALSQEGNGSLEVGGNDISGYKDGVTVNTAYIHDNYIHNLSQFSGAHTQGVYVYNGGAVRIIHNTIINDTALQYATAAVYIAPDSPVQRNRTISDNLLAGGALTVYGGDSGATGIVVTDNRFSTQITSSCGYYGTDGYWQAGNQGNVWSGNTWYDGPNAGKSISP